MNLKFFSFFLFCSQCIPFFSLRFSSSLPGNAKMKNGNFYLIQKGTVRFGSLATKSNSARSHEISFFSCSKYIQFRSHFFLSFNTIKYFEQISLPSLSLSLFLYSTYLTFLVPSFTLEQTLNSLRFFPVTLRKHSLTTMAYHTQATNETPPRQLS